MSTVETPVETAAGETAVETAAGETAAGETAAVASGAETVAWSKSIGAISLFVEDLAPAKQFYTDVFDVPCVYEDDNSAVFKFGEVMINLLVSTEAPDLIKPAAVGRSDAGARFQLSIFVEDVDAACKDLASRGVEFINGPMDREWGMRTACFADPGGHIWEVAQELQ